MKLLVLGGTRFVGPSIVEAALAKKHAITLFNRGKTNPELFPGVERLRGDRDAKELGALAGRKWDAVIDTYVEKPRLVREALDVLAPNVGQYVFVSSVSVYADVSKPGVDESAPVEELADPKTEDMGSAYENFGGMKAESERVVNERMKEHATIVRPHLIVGPGDRSDRLPYWVARVARGGDVLAPSIAGRPVQMIDVRDLGRFVVRLVDDGHGGTFNAAGPKGELAFDELLHGVKVIAGSDARFTWADTAWLIERGVAPWKDLPLWAGPGLEGIHSISNAKALAMGLELRPIGDTLRDVLKELATRDPKTPWRSGLAAEREAELLRAWRAR